MELPILVNHLVQSVTSKERNPLQPHYECELLREVKAHLKIQNENLHPHTLAIAEDVIEQLIERFLGSAQAIAQHCFRMEVKVEDFEYSVESWLRNSVPQKLDLALNDWFLEFSSMTERYRILPESEDNEEDEDDESYTPSESDSDSIDSEVSAADSDADEELEDDFDMDEEEEDMEVDEDSEDFYDKLSPSQFSEQSNEDSNILNTSSNVDRRYESLSGDRLLHFRRYCQNLREHLVYCLIPDEVFISLHRFLFSQLYLSFQANPICLLTKGGFTPLGLLNHYLIASDSLREQKRTQSFIQDSIVKQRHSLYEEKEKSKDLLLTLQELIRTLKGIQSPSSSDKENQPIFQSPVYKRPISDPSATPVAPHTTSTVPTADLIPVHPHLLNSLAKQLKESEEKVQQLQTQLVMQSQKKEVSKTNAPLTTKKEKKLKSLLSDLMRLVESEDDQGIETTVKKSSSSNILDDVDMPTESFHRYPFGGSKELGESEEIDSKDLARKTTSEPNVNLLQRFQSTTSEELKVALLEDEDENAATTQTSSGIVFNSSKKRKYGFLESSDPQYMYGSPEWNEKIEAWQKRVRSQQPQQKGDEKNTTPSIFDRFK